MTETLLERAIGFVSAGRLSAEQDDPFASLDDEFDFLGEVEQDVNSTWRPRSEPGAPRRDAAEALIAAIKTDAEAPVDQWLARLGALIVDGPVDGDAASVALSALLQAEGEASLDDHSPLAKLFDAVLAAGGADERELGAVAVRLIHRFGCAASQVAVARWLHRNAEVFDDIEAALDCLATIGDGRCVRAMEALLMERPAAMNEHQAWRARHIVQLIRRDHRR